MGFLLCAQTQDRTVSTSVKVVGWDFRLVKGNHKNTTRHVCHENNEERYMILTLKSQEMMCQLRSMGSGGLNQEKVEEELPGKRPKQFGVSSSGP